MDLQKRKAAVAIVFIVIGSIFFIFGVAVKYSISSRQISDVSDRANRLPAQNLPLLPPQQGSVDLSSLKGPALVNMWASWCAACRHEHQDLLDLAERGATIYGINFMDSPEKAEQYLTRYDSPFTLSVADPLGDTTVPLGVTGLPQTLYINAAGVIELRIEGAVNAAAMSLFEEMNLIPIPADANVQP